MRRVLVAAALALVSAGQIAPAAAQTPFVSEFAAPADALSYYRVRTDARSAHAAGDYAEAARLFEQAVAVYGLDAEVWAGLADARRRSGQAAPAIAAYERAIALGGPGYRYARHRIALLYMELGDHEAALRTLTQLINEDAYLYRAALMGREEFAPLRADPRFRALAGELDTSALSRAEGWRADLDYLVAEMQRVNPHLRGQALPQNVANLHAELRANADRLSDEEMMAGMSRLVGALSQNHTNFWGGWFDGSRPERPALSYLPVQLYLFPEGAFIVRGDGAASDLAGAQVLAVDGVAFADVAARVRPAMSAASDVEVAWTSPFKFIDLALLHGLGVTERADRASLRLRLRNGRVVTRTLRGAEAPIVAKLPAPAGVSAPLFLRRLAESHWLEVWEREDAVYAQVNQIAPDEDETLAEFGLRLRRTLEESGARNLVLDLRNNNGGDSFTYIELLRTVIAFSAGTDHRVYVLIGRNTYSAAANLTTELQRLATPVFVGEPTSAIGNQDGDEVLIRLPYSGLHATVAGVWWQMSDPWDERRFQAPHVPVSLTAADYFASRDPALDTVRALMAR